MLLVAATPFELQACHVTSAPSVPGLSTLVCGVGPVEAALRLALALQKAKIECDIPDFVLNFGIAGAYVGAGADILEICLATSESLADLGKMQGGALTPLTVPGCEIPAHFALDGGLRSRLTAGLAKSGFAVRSGPFLTVSCASDRPRADVLLSRFPDALCENMEGAALARVCAHFGVPFAELRAVSNFVDNPENQHWRLKAACARAGAAVRCLWDISP